MATLASAMAQPPALKSVRRILAAPSRHWVGDGFHVFPVFHDLAFSEELSPFLMFDYASPKHFGPTRKRRGVGQHPHRGFETVTLAFQGEIEHGDSAGNRGVIGPGDAQWMTAARGIIHEEFHSDSFSKTGGTIEMCQIWVNLPSQHKMIAPRYQPVATGDIPVVQLIGRHADEGAAMACAVGAAPSNGTLRVIAGTFNGTAGAAQTMSPVEMWDVSLRVPGVEFDLAVPDGHNCVVFVRRGGAVVVSDGGEQAIGPQGVALMHRSGTTLRLRASVAETQLLLLGGEPLGESIAARGPFVMNTQAEIQQANADFQSGRMGR